MTTSISSVIKKLLVIFLVVSGLYFAKEFLIPISIGGILATVFLPLSKWIEKKKLPKAVAVFICFLSLILIIFLFISLLGYKISQFISEISLIKQKGIEIGSEIQKYILNHLNISIDDQFRILKNEQPSYGNIVQIMIGSITGFLSNFVIILVYFIFILYYRNHIKNFLIKLTPKAENSEIENIIKKITTVSQQYLLGLFKMIFLLWIMYGIGFSIIGVENAVFIGILCGLLEIIPFVGNITGTLLAILVTTIHGGTSESILGILIVYGIVQAIQGWILQPLILGPQVKINSLFTIIALILGQLLWGISGIILAIPLTAMFKIVCDSIEPMKPYGFLIGEIETSKKEMKFYKQLKYKFKKL